MCVERGREEIGKNDFENDADPPADLLSRLQDFEVELCRAAASRRDRSESVCGATCQQFSLPVVGSAGRPVSRTRLWFLTTNGGTQNGSSVGTCTRYT